MEQIVTERVVKQSRSAGKYVPSAWPAMAHLLEAVKSAESRLVDSESCLEILAADISDERIRGSAMPFTYAGSAIEHWEDSYLRLVASGFERMLGTGRQLAPVQMYMLRDAALKQLFPFEQSGLFKQTGEAGMQETSPAAMLSFAPKTSVFEGYENDMTPSERQYNGK